MAKLQRNTTTLIVSQELHLLRLDDGLRLPGKASQKVSVYRN
jgi:hypothetical protein